jgi:glycine/D-amino acid oxidase-like deaminating enzyme
LDNYDRIIIGAGMYGMYAAAHSARSGRSTLVMDCDAAPFQRGSYVNQARLHNGYHYPRSYSTAIKSAKYFNRFLTDYNDCVMRDFDQIYAVASHYSWTSGKQFERFCRNVGVRCDEIAVGQYFNKHTVEKAFLTDECTFDAELICERMYHEARSLGVEFAFDREIAVISKQERFFIRTTDEEYSAPWVLNATYAGINQIHSLLGLELLNIKYELCEVILCDVSDNLKRVGLTVMDGPFFSVMPFGKSGYHSITTVSKTPHVTSYDILPTFDCQRDGCSPLHMRNCNTCPRHPDTAFTEMCQTAKKYMRDDVKIEYVRSLFTLKPILKVSEIDDSRPTIIRQYSEHPYFYTVFSGKINTMYDLDSILEADN